jgi:hypothetical protein
VHGQVRMWLSGFRQPRGFPHRREDGCSTTSVTRFTPTDVRNCECDLGYHVSPYQVFPMKMGTIPVHQCTTIRKSNSLPCVPGLQAVSIQEDEHFSPPRTCLETANCSPRVMSREYWRRLPRWLVWQLLTSSRLGHGFSSHTNAVG